MFLEKLLEWAVIIHRSGLYLPTPKLDLVTVFRRLWWITYRHELFHFHVELYATRLESALRHPVYRPYVECVRAQVANTPEWWEEALAQAVVLPSKMVKRALGIDKKYIEAYIVPYFQIFPEGYRRFECESEEPTARTHSCRHRSRAQRSQSPSRSETPPSRSPRTSTAHAMTPSPGT
jgi:hypothetical protein